MPILSRRRFLVLSTIASATACTGGATALDSGGGGPSDSGDPSDGSSPIRPSLPIPKPQVERSVLHYPPRDM